MFRFVADDMWTALQVKGTDYETPDGTCIRDYIDVTDLVDAHVKALDKAEPNKVGIYNVGTGKGPLMPFLLFSFLHLHFWGLLDFRS